jgi:zinc transporter family protein
VKTSLESVHVLVPGGWTVRLGHTLLEALERDLRAELPGTTVVTHLEPLDDPVSRDDTELDRTAAPASREMGDQDLSHAGAAIDSDR